MVDQLLLLYAGRTVTSVYARIHFDNAPASPTDTHALLIVGFDGACRVFCVCGARVFVLATDLG